MLDFMKKEVPPDITTYISTIYTPYPYLPLFIKYFIKKPKFFYYTIAYVKYIYYISVIIKG